MCEICHCTPCAPGCPNRKQNFVQCDECGESIYVGDEFVVDEDESGMILCEKCANKLIDEYQSRIDTLYYGIDKLTEEDLENL